MSTFIPDVGDVYGVGDRPPLIAYTTDATGAPADPTTAVFTVRRPDGTTITPTVDHPATGVYVCSPLVDQVGRWAYRLVTTGPIEGSEWREFMVDPSPFDAVTRTGFDTWRPSVADVAAIVSHRTGDRTGMARLSFTSESVPNAAQVDRIIRQVQAEVAAVTGAMPAELTVANDGAMGPASSPAGHVVALGAASYVELQFWPDQQLGVESVASQLWDRYVASRADLVKAVEDIRSGQEPGTEPSQVRPVASFPDAVGLGVGTSLWERF